MASHGKKPGDYFGPWKGSDERTGEVDSGDIEALWNVEIDSDMLVTRGGRVPYGLANQPLTIYPTSVLRYGTQKDAGTGSASEKKDYTKETTDERADTYADLGNIGKNATDSLWIGLPSPVSTIHFDIYSPNTNTIIGGASVTYNYFSAANGLTPLTVVSDGTIAVIGSPCKFAQSGDVVFTKPADWVPQSHHDDGNGVPPIVNEQSIYWIQVKFGKLSAGCKLAGIYAIADQGTLALLQGANGLFQWKMPTGERVLVVGMDDRENGIGRLFAMDRVSRKLRPFTIPGELAKSGPGAFWSFAAVPEGLIACNGYCFMHSTTAQPFLMRPFKPYALVDYATRENKPPAVAKYVGIFEDRIFAILNEKRVQWSQPIGSIDMFSNPSEPPLGGMNAWYTVDSDVDIIDSAGGELTGMAPSGHHLVVFTSRSTWALDIGADAPSLRCLDPNIGCVAPRSIANVNDAVFFIGQDGVFVQAGGTNTCISNEIPKTIAGLNRFGLMNACGAIYRKRKQYRLWVPNGDNNKNNLGMVFHYEGRKGWSFFGLPQFVLPGTKFKKYECSMLLSAGDEEWGEELLSVDYDGLVWLEDYGEMDDTKAILSAIVFAPFKGENQSVATVRDIRVTMLTRGEGRGVRCALLTNGETWRRAPLSDNIGFIPGENVAQQTQDMSQLDPSFDVDTQLYCDWVSGDVRGARFGIDTWRERRLIQRKVSLSRTGRTFQLVLHSGADGVVASMAVKGLEFNFKPRTEARGEP